MPARILDGDGLWRSKKLKSVEERFRAEYANLLPLAEANGVFDCDPDRVWSDVYAFNRPEVDVETVEEILDVFERADLLQRWTEGGKTWGFWTGITKSGRLPSEAHIKRYKNLPPSPPPGLSRIMPEGIGIGLVLDRIGLDREAETQNTLLEDTDMKAEKVIPTSCRQILGIKAETYPDVINQIRALAILTSNGQVVQEFEDWARENRGDEFYSKPLSAFLRSRDSINMESKSAAEDPQVLHLARELAYRSDNTVAFDHKAKAGLAKLLVEYTVDEVISIFRTDFFPAIQDDPKQLPFAAKNFVEKADQLLYTARRKKAEKEAADAAIEAAKVSMQSVAEEERRRRAEAAERDAALIEDELPD